MSQPVSRSLHTLLLPLFTAVCFAAPVLGQCAGIYFSPSFRVIDKVPYQHGYFFPLDDWTGDGRKDFWNFRANISTSTHDILIYPAKPSGFWDWDNPIVYTTTIPSTASLLNSNRVVKDFDSDGRIDLMYRDNIYRNAGDGTLLKLAQFTHSDATVAAFMGTLGYVDLNGDGQLDWVYHASVHPTGQEIRYQLGNADGSFSYRVVVAAHTTQNGLNNSAKAIGDFDGDGDFDITYSNTISGVPQYAMIRNTGGGVFQMGPLTPLDVSVGGSVRDFNSDGRADIATGLQNDLVILFGQANGTLARAQVATGGAGAFPTDINGDSKIDFFEWGYFSYSVLLNDGNGSFVRTSYAHPLGTGLPQYIEDFSGDGKADIYAGVGANNLFGEMVTVVHVQGCDPIPLPKKMNFFPDQTPDIAMWNPTTGNWSSKNATIGMESATVFNWGLGSLGDVPAPGDFDGDYRTDYSVYRNSTGTWYIRRSSDSAWYVFRFGLTGDIAIPNDYNGGGKTDIAVFRPSDGNWHIWYSETQQYQAVHFGANGDKPVPADYDGDGKTDIAVFRPGDGVWYYLRSSDSGVRIVKWGISTDVPLPADIDGDAKADLVVYRGGTWYVLRSYNGAFGVFYWGVSSDIPLIASGDPASGFIVYRALYSWWYPYTTVYPTQVIPLGGNGDIPVYYGLPNN